MNIKKKRFRKRFISFIWRSNNEKKKENNQKSSISDLSRNPYQPRHILMKNKLEELSNSIKKNGLIQPIAVRVNK